MLSKEEIEKQVLNTETSKHPLLNEIYAIRDRRKETEDYTIYVDGYISVDVLNKTLQLETNNKKLIEKLEERRKQNNKRYGYSIDDDEFPEMYEYSGQVQEDDYILKLLKGEKE